MTASREVTKSVLSRWQDEGHGARVRRSVGNSQVEDSFNTYPARPVCWSGWISDSYCSLKPLCSGMGEVVPARTSPTLLTPSPRTVLS